MSHEDYMSMSVRDFIAATAAKTPTPGGGSVASTVGALAAALGQMSLNFTRGKKNFAAHEEYYSHLSGRLEKTQKMFIDLVSDDVAAYKLYQETSRQPDGPEKSNAVQVAVAAAINVPRETAKLALALMEDLLGLADKCNPWLISDLAAGAALAVAVVKLCDYNVRVNAPNVEDRKAAEQIHKASADDVKQSQKLLAEIEKAASKYLK